MTYAVQCAHCGKIYCGDSQALTWFNAQACVGSHQVKTYEYAPHLKPAPGIAVDPAPQEKTR